MKSRVLIVFSGFLALWGLLVLRAGWLQLVPDVRLEKLKDRQFQSVMTLQSRRGPILDRNGRELAVSMTAYSLYADPKILEGRKKLSKRLAKALGLSSEVVFGKIKDPSRRFVWLARLLPRERYDLIKSWDIRGLSFVEEYKRVYPNETLLSTTLGFIGGEGQGLEGVELWHDKTLQGDRKKVMVRRDARGRPLVADGMMFAENLEGAEVQLTIDSEIQHVLENELALVTSEFEADQAYGVILDAKTSAIVAMAGTPGFDLNTAQKADPEVRRNRVVTDAFEPGSVIKTFAIAAALREKKIAPNTKIDTEGGRLQVGDRVIREADEHHSWKSLTVGEVLAFSSNVGTTKIAFMLGEEKLRSAFADFGFGQKSGVDLPGEAKGTLLPLPWRSHLLSNVSFGQGMTASPLQIANAYAVIANGGVFNEPYLTQAARNPETGVLEERKFKEGRRVLSPEDAAAMRVMLAGVTAPGGTGVNAKVDGYVIAGKTGTAQKVNPSGRGYLSKAYISSFAGFIPANDPKYVLFVAVDYPKSKIYYGSQVAAPLFSKLSSYLVRKEGVAPLTLSEKNLVPRVKRDLAMDKESTDQVFHSLNVKTAAEILAEARAESLDVVPELSGMTMRQVIQRFAGHPIEIKFQGKGVVSEVWPEPGTQIEGLRRIVVELR